MNKSKKLPVNQIICGDSIEVLSQFPEESIDMVMFSPPYWGLRDYHVKGQIGVEEHPQIFIEKIVDLCRLLRKVLKKHGNMYINLGDTYFGKIMWIDWVKKGHPSKETTPPEDMGHAKDNLKPDGKWFQNKQLMLMPARVAIALQNDGWILRNDIIWYKPNHMPSSVKDRLTNSYEHIFHFVKSKRYYYDLDAIRVPIPKETQKRYKRKAYSNGKYTGKNGVLKDKAKCMGASSFQKKNQPYAVQPREKEFVEYRNLSPLKEIAEYLNYWRKKQGLTIDEVEAKLKSQAPHHWFNAESYPTKEDWLRIKQLLNFDDKYDRQMLQTFTKPSIKQNFPLGKNPADMWSINTKGFKGAHFAVYPEQICVAPIKASCPSQICRECGKPRKRLTTAPFKGQTLSRKYLRPDGKDDLRPPPKDAKYEGVTIGFSDCGCGKGWEAGIVLDPMCGSGTTLVVAHKLGYRWIGIDLNKDYCKIARKRLESVGAYSKKIGDYI